MRAKLLAKPNQPAIKPAIVLKNVQWSNPEVIVNGKTLARGKDFQHGTVKELEQWKTIIWLNATYDKNVDLLIKKTIRPSQTNY